MASPPGAGGYVKKGGVIMRRVWMYVLALSISAGVSSLYPQAAPSWIPQGDLSGAYRVYDIFEIPNTNIVIAVGQRVYRSYSGYYYYGPAIWRSTNGGVTWSRRLALPTDGGYYWHAFHNIAYDSSRNMLFTACDTRDNYNYQTVWYSDDYGENWHPIYHPSIIGIAGADYCAVLDGKLYVFYPWQHVGMVYHTPLLLALDYSDPNPDNWVWYLVKQYPQISSDGDFYWGKLAVKDGKLYVIGKDKETDAIRIYTYEPSKLNSSMKRLGTVGEFRAYYEAHASELSSAMNPDSTGTTQR